MGTTEPIRDPAELTKFREYYHTEHPQTRNYALIMLGLHSAQNLRLSRLETGRAACTAYGYFQSLFL